MMATEDIGIPIREMWEKCGREVTLSIRVSDKTHWRGSRLQSKLADALSQYRRLLNIIALVSSR